MREGRWVDDVEDWVRENSFLVLTAVPAAPPTLLAPPERTPGVFDHTVAADGGIVGQ